jgi:hypothetical protein
VRTPILILAGILIYTGAWLIAHHAPVLNMNFARIFSSSEKDDRPRPIEYPPAADVGSVFSFNFSEEGVLEEGGSEAESKSPYWWVNSGGALIIEGGTGETMQGEAELFSRWRLRYLFSNPRDTDGGAHPQNIFRLITRSVWRDVEEEVYFRILADNPSRSANRGESNGVLLFSRYADDDNLYYAGVRVDGAAVIKKKIKGVYYTMAYAKIFEGSEYDREKQESLLPENTWVGLRSTVKDEKNGETHIRLFIDRGRKGMWDTVLEATDGKGVYGEDVIREGRGGIRTDFMDVEFDDYRIERL